MHFIDWDGTNGLVYKTSQFPLSISVIGQHFQKCSVNCISQCFAFTEVLDETWVPAKSSHSPVSPAENMHTLSLLCEYFPTRWNTHSVYQKLCNRNLTSHYFIPLYFVTWHNSFSVLVISLLNSQYSTQEIDYTHIRYLKRSCQSKVLYRNMGRQFKYKVM